MNIPQTVLAVLFAILGILILCQPQPSPKIERLGGNFLEESDIEDDYFI